jgi:hypothetical protein
MAVNSTHREVEVGNDPQGKDLSGTVRRERIALDCPREYDLPHIDLERVDDDAERILSNQNNGV